MAKEKDQVSSAIRVPLKHLHIHTQILIPGFGRIEEKTDAKMKGVAIVHYMNGERNEIHISTPGGDSCYFPFSNVLSATPMNAADADIEVLKPKAPVPVNPVLQGKIQAQVQMPPGLLNK